jgi:hypothetical protein
VARIRAGTQCEVDDLGDRHLPAAADARIEPIVSEAPPASVERVMSGIDLGA